jgi:hypothetical protein
VKRTIASKNAVAARDVSRCVDQSGWNTAAASRNDVAVQKASRVEPPSSAETD